MKKYAFVFAATISLVFAGAAAAPYWIGVKTEEAFHDRLAALASSSGLTVAEQQFERGWLSSRARTVLHVPGLPVEIVADHLINHGPVRIDRWFASEPSFIVLAAHIETQAAIKPQAGTSGVSLPFSIVTTIAFDGEGRASVDSSALSRAATNFEWLGLKGDVRFDSKFRHIRINLHAPRLGYGPVEITDIGFTADMDEGIADHYLGKASVEVGSVSVGPLLQAKKIGFSSDSRAEGGNLAVSVVYNVAELHTLNGRFGPGKLAIEIRNLDALTLAHFRQEMNALRRGDRPQEQIGLIRLGKLMQLVGELARKSPELEITELRLRMSEADIVGRAKLRLDGSKSDLTQNPLLILTAAAGDAEVSLPPTALRPILLPLLIADLEDYRRRGLLESQSMTPEQMAAILDQALPMYIARHEFTRRLVHESGRYKLSASLRRGQILINGEPLKLPGTDVLPR